MKDSDKPVVTLEDVKTSGLALRQVIADVDGPLPPAFVVEFLLKHWRRYMALTIHDYGTASEEWTHALDTTRRLLFSLLPIATSDERSRLTRSLPMLIADIKIGMDTASMEADERDSFLKELREYHLAMLDPGRRTDHTVPPVDLADTIAMDFRDPRYRALLDRLDGADSVEHIDM